MTPEKEKYPRDEKNELKCDGLGKKERQGCLMQKKKESVKKGAEKALGMKPKAKKEEQPDE